MKQKTSNIVSFNHYEFFQWFIKINCIAEYKLILKNFNCNYKKHWVFYVGNKTFLEGRQEIFLIFVLNTFLFIVTWAENP